MNEPKLIIFSAPSGSGKSTIVKEIMNKDIPMAFSVSATNRPARGNEIHKVDYYFLSTEEFKKKIKNDEFLEWEEVYENKFYGTLKSEVESILNQGVNVVFDIDVMGGINIKKFYADRALSIFIRVPDTKILKQRLINRATDSLEVIETRVEKAEIEMQFADKFDIIIDNLDLNTAVEETYNHIKDFIYEK
jgi:guanylate kinase